MTRRRRRPYDVGRTCRQCGGPLAYYRGGYRQCRRCRWAEWRPDKANVDPDPDGDRQREEGA